MPVKRIIASITVVLLVFAAGYSLAAFNFKQRLSAYEKRISTMARSRNSSVMLKEIEVLVNVYHGYMHHDEKVRDALCKFMALKVKHMAEDRELIREGLRDDNGKEMAGFTEGTKIIDDISGRELEVAVRAAQQIGCN
jgi:hypothetical protein